MLQLCKAMWPSIVGKGEGADEPVISLEHMLELAVQTQVNGQGFDGIDLNLMHPHLDIDADKDDMLRFADGVSESGLYIGSEGAPVWSSAGSGSAKDNQADMAAYLSFLVGIQCP